VGGVLGKARPSLLPVQHKVVAVGASPSTRGGQGLSLPAVRKSPGTPFCSPRRIGGPGSAPAGAGVPSAMIKRADWCGADDISSGASAFARMAILEIPGAAPCSSRPPPCSTGPGRRDTSHGREERLRARPGRHPRGFSARSSRGRAARQVLGQGVVKESSTRTEKAGTGTLRAAVRVSVAVT